MKLFRRPNEAQLDEEVQPENLKQVVDLEDAFDILFDQHQALGHPGIRLLHLTCNKLVYNISRDQVKWFTDRCGTCVIKHCHLPREQVVKPIRTSKVRDRGQVDLMDYQSISYNGYRWVMVYQDHFSKFVVLRPLKAKRAVEVAKELFSIFTLIGAPLLLHSDNGREEQKASLYLGTQNSF